MKRGTKYIASALRAASTPPQSGPSATLPCWAYTCPELGRTCPRPGAYDAFDLPSVFGSRRHFPDGRVLPAKTPAPDQAGSRELFDIKLLPVLHEKLKAGTLTIADQGDLDAATAFLETKAQAERSAA